MSEFKEFLTSQKERRPELKLYALLDAAPIGKLQEILKKEFSNLAIRSLYEGVRNDVSEVEPLLIEIESAPAIFLDWIQKQSAKYSFATMLWSPLGLEKLAIHLEALLDQTLHDGQAVVFRFFDPRIGAAIIPLLKENQQQVLYGSAIHIWGMWDRCGQWLFFENQKPDATTPLSAALNITKAQLTALSQASLPDQITARINEYNRGLLLDKTPCEIYHHVVKIIHEAHEQYELVSEQDLGLYGIFAIQFTKDWQSVEPFASAFAKVKAGKTSFSDAIDHTPDTAWHTFQKKHPDYVNGEID